MNNNLLRFKNDLNLVIFDYETCNLNLCLETNKPWQLAFIVIEDGRVTGRHDYHLKWEDLKLSPDAARITGFNEKKHNELAVDPQVALDHFEKYLYDDTFLKIGHNILGFDIYIHSIHRRLLGLSPDYSYLNEALDTVSLARAVKKEIPFKNGSLISWQYKLLDLKERGLRVSLQQCCKDYSIEFDPKKLHNALYDIEMNFKVFRKQLFELEI